MAEESSIPTGQAYIKSAVVAAMAIVMTTLVICQMPEWINGPYYWKWAWRPLAPTPTYLIFLLAFLPILIAQQVRRSSFLSRGVAILLLMIGCCAIKLATAAQRTSPPSLDEMVAVVEHPFMTSYYTDAASIQDRPLRSWMRDFPQLMGGFHLHSQSKPPGPTLYWWLLIRWGGENHHTAYVGGLLLGLLAALAIPATYWMLKLLLRSESAAFCGASFLSLCPGFLLFFPMFDPVYILLSAPMIACWVAALRTNRMSWSIAFGLSLTISILFNFSTLTLGTFLIAMIFVDHGDRSMRDQLRIVIRQGSIAIGVLLIASLVLWLTISYNPIATFAGAWHHQHLLLTEHADQRPYPLTAVFDLWDFALGSGWISVALILCWFLSPRKSSETAIVIAAVGQFLLVAVTGLLQSETSRVWNFMLPLLMIPIGLELSRWPVSARIIALASLALVAAAIHQNMGFLF